MALSDEIFDVVDENDRVIGVYERCGFVREAELRDRSWKDGRFVDHVVLSVTREGFAKARREWAGSMSSKIPSTLAAA